MTADLIIDVSLYGFRKLIPDVRFDMLTNECVDMRADT